MDSKMIEIKDYKGRGYKPLVSFGSWRVAILCALDELMPDRIGSMERHHATDEVFVLTAGKVMLFLGGNEPEVKDFTPVIMKIGEIYNIKKNTWHTLVPSEDAHIVIVENDDTCEDNSEHAILSNELAALIQNRAREFLST